MRPLPSSHRLPTGPSLIRRLSIGDRAAGARALLGPLALVTLALVILALATLACGETGPSPDAVARVGDEELHRDAFTAYVESQLGGDAGGLEAEVLSRLLDQWIEERLLVKAALDDGLIEPPDLVGAGAGGPDNEPTGEPGSSARGGEDDGSVDDPPAVRPAARARVDRESWRRALQALMATRRAEMADPSERELRELYDERREELTLPERVLLYQILTETREEAEAALADLKAGAHFTEVARERSQDPSAPWGGLQGELAREDLPQAFAEVVFDLEPGAVSEIVAADYGFHIFWVEARLPPWALSFEEAAPQLEQELRRGRVDRRLEALVDDARSRYTVEIYEQNLWFDYQPSSRTRAAAPGSPQRVAS